MLMRFTLLFAVLIGGVVAAEAQRRGTAPVPAKPTATPAPTPDPVREKISNTQKKNERPMVQSPDRQGAEIVDPASLQNSEPAPYRYEFTQPDFVIDRIVIEHGENGRGIISFSKRGREEMIAEPIQVSAATLEKLRAAFDSLNFLDSTESYQYERDFSNMGNVAITLKKEGRERTAKYNWTSNKDAKFLMDEYRRIGNQYVWMFDFNLARANQPLETPKLVDNLDALMKRNEIADPLQMLPFLQAINNDERVPLIGRNHAGKLVKQIEKQKK